jgi:CDP-diacylglycerol--serine O-phosphatidyltransferase
MAPKVGLPNALTLACLGLSFAIIGAAGQGETALGLRLLAFCLLADGLAGRAAKRPGASTELGAELDSLGALLAYGVAAPLLAFTAGLEAWGWQGWALCGALALACGLRLARDNADSPDFPHYQGLPPAASAFVMGGALAQGVGGLVLALLILGACVLMLSPLRYPRLKLPLPLLAPLGLLLAAAALGWQPAWLGLAAVGLAYALAAWAFALPSAADTAPTQG